MQVFVVLDDRAGDSEPKKVYVFRSHAAALQCRQELKLDHWHLWGAAVDCYESKAR